MARPYKYQDETRQLTFRLPTALIRALDEAARKQNKPRTEIVIETLLAKHPMKHVKNPFS